MTKRTRLVIAAALLFGFTTMAIGSYGMGQEEGRAENQVTQQDLTAFQACMNSERDLQVQDGGPLNYGPCFADTVLSWQKP